MPHDFEQLMDVISPRAVEEQVFVGANMHPEAVRVYGGQVLAQCLSAAVATVPPGREVHSQHAYFLRPGNPAQPIRLEVEIAPGRFGGDSRTLWQLGFVQPFEAGELADGRARWDALEAGVYTLMVRCAGHALAMREVELDGDIELSVELSPARACDVVVTTGAGEAVRHAAVYARSLEQAVGAPLIARQLGRTDERA